MASTSNAPPARPVWMPSTHSCESGSQLRRSPLAPLLLSGFDGRRCRVLVELSFSVPVPSCASRIGEIDTNDAVFRTTRVRLQPLIFINLRRERPHEPRVVVHDESPRREELPAFSARGCNALAAIHNNLDGQVVHQRISGIHQHDRRRSRAIRLS